MHSYYDEYNGTYGAMKTYAVENIEQVFEGGQLSNQLLDHFAEGFKDGVVVDACEVEAVM
jgi:hypothetical protein